MIILSLNVELQHVFLITGLNDVQSIYLRSEFVVHFLTDRPQCNIDAEDDSKGRPLHLALRRRNVDIVHHLVFIKQCFTNSDDMKRVAQLASFSVKNFKQFASSQLPESEIYKHFKMVIYA